MNQRIRRPKGNHTHTLDPNLIRSLYFGKGLSQREIGKRFDLGVSSIFRLFQRLGIRTRGKKEQKRYKNAIALDALRADEQYRDGISITELSERSGLDAYSVRCYLVDKGLKIRSQGEQRAITYRRNRQGCEYSQACAERKRARVTEATFYLAGGEKLIVKYDEEGRALNSDE